jgi:hypothetical protein
VGLNHNVITRDQVIAIPAMCLSSYQTLRLEYVDTDR